MTDEQAVLNLLSRYGILMDAGDFDGASALLSKARIRLPGPRTVAGGDMRDIWRDLIILHPCGTPRTQHVITNPVLEMDHAAGTARCQSCYTVLQQTASLPLQVIAAGRYDDQFARDQNGWHFTGRDYTQMTLSGDLSQHLRMPPA